ncbi:ribonuclease T2 [Sphingomonas hengshuiensis]|uniref:Ribonuclease T n=1 Tax=Sphingomonas hengshuiensis TaxID=1609977 RepID=A0A7U4J6D7_9SPHN|nr:ribonuclease T2 [Sphingomonas hengshuiensis]AJP71074.1 ribonuclease T [Sphingomonas hengshuiensis]
MKAPLLLAAAMLGVVPQGAQAQAQMCRVPARVPAPHPDLPSDREPRRVLPIGSYTLALSWSPGYCRGHGDDPKAAFQCGGGNRFGFTLHGLWPDGVGREWPQYCRATGIVPAPVIRQTLCATPSAQLIQHEWAKHGTCMPGSPQSYFATARGLYGKVRYPDMAALSRAPLTVAGFRSAMARANPGMPADAIRVTATREGWLDELWLCLDKALRYRRCTPGSGGAPDGAALRIWRGN